MKRKQLLFCVETNQKSDTDFRYISGAVKHFYETEGHVLLWPVYMEGKYKYSSKSVKREISKLSSDFHKGSKNGETFVFLCIDCDRYDSDPKGRNFLKDAKEYCLNKPNTFLIWFCRDVEDVFHGHPVTDSQKKKEADRFQAKKMIESFDVEKLRANRYREHYSNLCLVLDEILDRKQSR